jgi:putative DNA primase/helicase
MKNLVLKLRAFVLSAMAKLTDRAHHQPVNYINIKALLLHMCDFDDDLCLWVMRWLAYPMRNPGAKMSRALVVAGPEGTGKTLFFERIVTLLYDDGSARISPEPLRSDCGWPTGTRLVMFNGVLSQPNAERLKHLITAENLWYPQLDGAPIRRRNRANFVFLTSSPVVLAAEKVSRRFSIVRAPAPMSEAFYRSVADEIANGGVEAFRRFLMRDLDMGDFDELTPPPITGRRAHMIAA